MQPGPACAAPELQLEAEADLSQNQGHDFMGANDDYVGILGPHIMVVVGVGLAPHIIIFRGVPFVHPGRIIFFYVSFQSVILRRF